MVISMAMLCIKACDNLSVHRKKEKVVISHFERARSSLKQAVTRPTTQHSHITAQSQEKATHIGIFIITVQPKVYHNVLHVQ